MTVGPADHKTPRWLLLVGAIVLALVVGGIAFALTRVTPTTGTSPTSVASPTEVVTPSETPTPSPTPTKVQTPYCKAFSAITAGGVETGGDEGGADFAKLSKTFSDLIAKYSAAAKLAPKNLTTAYATVLSYLKQGKQAVDSRDLDQLKEMVKNLDSLNETMTTIQTESQKLCG
jgi:hypothetical protein